MDGIIQQINIKNKNPQGIGLPKIPVEKVKVTSKGLEGDYNNYRMKSKAGTSDRAVLIFCSDKLTELNNEGWPIKPGDIGENFLIKHYSYDTIKIGDRFQLGDVLAIQITEKCHPCNVLANLDYIGDGKIKSFIKTMVNRRGWYAKVLIEGDVSIGDSFIKIN